MIHWENGRQWSTLFNQDNGSRLPGSPGQDRHQVVTQYTQYCTQGHKLHHEWHNGKKQKFVLDLKSHHSRMPSRSLAVEFVVFPQPSGWATSCDCQVGVDDSLMLFVSSVCFATFLNHLYFTPALTSAKTLETTNIRRDDFAFSLEKEITQNTILIPVCF